jgi:rhamnose transport system permease protein
MIRRYQRELSVALAYALLLGLLVVLAPDFFSIKNLRELLVSKAPVLVAGVGMTLVILARHIDISIGSQFAICGIAAGLLARAGLPMPLVLAATLALGAGLGAVNGALVAGLGLPSIVVTLATMVTWREGLRWYQEGELVRGLPDGFQWLGTGQEIGQWIVAGTALAVLLVFAWGLRYLAAGREVYATGSDPEAARLAGVRPRRVVLAVFASMGVLTGLAALLSAIRLPHVDPKMGDGLELTVIAPVVLGGVAISGGRGTLLGTLLGVALLGTIGSALVFLRMEAHWQKAVEGVIVLAAVASDSLGIERRSAVGTARVTH